MLEIINQRYMFFLFEIAKKPKNISELAKKGDLTLSVASTLISRWAREGVVSKEKAEEGSGKIIVYLTKYGEEQVKLLKQINKNYKKNKEIILGSIELKCVNLVKNSKECESNVNNIAEKEGKNE